jgi:nucleoside-diphosphate-sugar epimerase
MENKRILVIGGTGYIGREIVKLISFKNNVTVLSIQDHKSNSVKYVKASVLDKPFLMSFLKDFDMVIYLAAIIRTFNKSKYKENVLGLKNTLEAMHENGIKKIIYFSTQNIYIPKTGHYGNSKKLCENIIKESNLDYLVIRPNYVYGVDKVNDFYKLFSIMKKFRICPVIGNGKNRVQPVNKMDIAEIVVSLLDDSDLKKEVNISGKTTLSLLDLINMIKQKSNLKVLTIKVPLCLLKPFKFFIPFDVDGYDSNRVSPKGALILYGESNIKDDISEIVKL